MPSNPVIDFIVTHHDEPFSIGKPFFDMLAMQQNVDFTSFRVILVQDGYLSTTPAWETLLNDYPYNIRIITISHGGPAHARNAGLQSATAEWVSFCDFDDMLSSVVTLNPFMDVLPAENADLIWMKTYWQRWIRKDDTLTSGIYLTREDFYHTHGKFYRRTTLQKHHIAFNPDLHYDYQSAFNHLLLSSIPSERVQVLTTDFYPYLKHLRKDSYTGTVQAITDSITDTFERDIYLTNEYQKRNLKRDYICMVAETIIDAYIILHCSSPLHENINIIDKAKEYCISHKNDFKTIRKSELEIVYDNCTSKLTAFIRDTYNTVGISIKTSDLRLDCITPWLERFTAYNVFFKIPERTERKNTERVVVYCGTRNIYKQMMTSAKSLLSHTVIDKIYFLIEDDTFPYDIPNIIETINIKPLALITFVENGPNFNNAWTYMCLIRAAFPDIFRDHDRILSLDIDVIINDDISELWNYDLSNYYIAGVPEPNRQLKPSDPFYINFGVVLMNLAILRKDNMPAKLCTALNTTKFGCPEQDAYNEFCTGHILNLPPDYNYTPFSHITAEPEREIITHYAGIKSWKHFDTFNKYTDMPWNEIMDKQNFLKGVTINAQE